MTESTEPMPEPLSETAAEEIAEQHRPVVPDEPHSAGGTGPETDAGEQIPVEDDEPDPPVG